jgi:hypothetical protein
MVVRNESSRARRSVDFDLFSNYNHKRQPTLADFKKNTTSSPQIKIDLWRKVDNCSIDARLIRCAGQAKNRVAIYQNLHKQWQKIAPSLISSYRCNRTSRPRRNYNYGLILKRKILRHNRSRSLNAHPFMRLQSLKKTHLFVDDHGRQPLSNRSDCECARIRIIS